jgi:hypothetical protein
VIIGVEGDHARQLSTGAEKRLWRAEGDHVNRHGSEEPFGKRLRQA